MSKLVMRFGGEPPSAGGRKPLVRLEAAEAFDALSNRPGEWAVVWEEVPAGSVYNRMKYLEALGCESVARKNGHPGKQNVWGRVPAES